MIKYSVIIPVYNKSEYLDDCILSIISQPFANMEVLLINDGSTDDSLSICREYESVEARIRIIDKENTGVSDTRNLGIQEARGEYIVFVDADDMLSENFFNVIDSYLVNQDVLFYKSCREFDVLNKIDTDSENCTIFDMKNILKSVVYNQHLIKNCNANFNRVTDYVVSRTLLLENNIKFDANLKVGEDKLFNFKLFQCVTSIDYINHFLYYIRTNNKSTMGAYNTKALESNIKMYEAFKYDIAKISDLTLRNELHNLLSCLGFQVVWNSVTSDYCHKQNKQSLSKRELQYQSCSIYLDPMALNYLNSYEAYLFKVFNTNFFLMNILMKNRPLRGCGYYLTRRH